MMTMTECPSHEQLQQFALGRLADDRSDVLFEHIEVCEHCRRQLEQAENLDDSLLAILREPEEPERYEAEPDCRVAVAKALDAQALIDTINSDNHSHLPNSIGEYDLVRPLGRGGMGSVYLARHSKLGRQVALKLLANHRLADPRMRKRFEAEMRAVGRLNHPNIVTAHDAREVDGTAVLVTEYIAGLDLEQIVNRVGPLSVAEACEIARQTAIALEYTDEQGFVHRDVKPSNIMLSEAGEVKLLDLGLARLQFGEPDHSEITGAGQVMGTADYVAPEQISDCRQVDIRADLYSLGCTLFKLLTGQPPFGGPKYPTAFAKLTAQVSDEPPVLSALLPDAPQTLVQLIKALLSKDPAQRPQSPATVAEALQPLAQGSDLKALIQRAQQLPSRPVAQPRSTSLAASSVALPFFKRKVPMSWAVGTGLVGLAAGICLGIIITITNPDGSTTTIKPAEGSDVTIRQDTSPSQHDEAKTEKPAKASLQDQLQGIWRAVSVLSGDKTLDLRNSVNLLAFEQGEYFLVSEGKLDEAGTFKLTQIGNIDLQDQFSHGQTALGIVRILSNGQLQICMDKSPNAQRPTSFSGMENGKTQNAITFERMTNSLYTNPLTMRDLNDPTKRPLYQAMSEMVVAHQMGPKNLKTHVATVQNDAKSAKTRNNLKMIAIAFINYHDAYRKLPGTANIHSSDKKKQYPYSWRVAILPFIEQAALYEQYHFEEPWDSEHNLTLLDKMPEIYRSPFASETQKPGETNYQGFAGEQTALGTGDGVAFKDITDGTANTLLVMDSGETVPWTKPSDLPFPTPPGQKMTLSREEIHYVSADGAVHVLPIKELDKLAALITRNGQEARATLPRR